MKNRSTVVPCSHGTGPYSKKKKYNPITKKEKKEEGKVSSEKKTSAAFYLSFG